MTTRIKAKLEGGDELLKVLRELGISVDDVLEAAVLAGAEVIREEAAGNAPGSGAIAKEIDAKKPGNVTAAVGPDKAHWYYQFLETGAQAHEIGPDTRQAMMFEGSEGEKFSRSIQHPGMAADPFLRPAVDGKRQDAVDSVGQVIRKAIEAKAAKAVASNAN